MNCPYCTNEDTSVLESRGLPGEDGIRRRRECKKCGKRFTTHERVVNIDLKVIKKSGKVFLPLNILKSSLTMSVMPVL